MSPLHAVPAQVPQRRVVVAISGASGAVYGVELLRQLREIPGVETHLVVSRAGWLNLRQELDLNEQSITALADAVYDVHEVGAAIASGSFQAQAMAVAPCSMRTLGAVAHGLSDNLITRAADVMLKERRRLVLVAREAPLNLAHLRNMTAVTEMGAIVFPPVPAFYLRPHSLQEMVSHSAARVVDLLGLPSSGPRWQGMDTDPASA
ncbi:MAG: UbiX family flavin prenyltransferase [Rhodoferax sp.]